ncbi:MAG: ribosomal protein [Ignavibacteria bacterium]|nr:ribosomal protein [Ignavibacteria bacterium]
MYAIVDIAGSQFSVEPRKILNVPALQGTPGDTLEFSNVLLAKNEDNVLVGSPYLSDSRIHARIVAHGRGDKVLVFHKKRRKGYSKLNGHKQHYTQIEITGIFFPGFEFIKEATATAVASIATEQIFDSEPDEMEDSVIETATPATFFDATEETSSDEQQSGVIRFEDDEIEDKEPDK